MRILVLASLLAASLSGLQEVTYAQPQPPQTGPEAGRTASVRVWLFPGAEKGSIDIAFSVGEGPEKTVMAGTTGGASLTGEGYQTIPEGQYLAQVRSGDRVVESAPVDFRKGSNYTMAVWNNAGRWQSKLFLDAGTPQKAERHIRVVNFADGREALLRLNGDKARVVPGSTVMEFPVQASIAMAEVEVRDPRGGAPALSSVEIDFSAFLNSYVVIAPDYRGRMRPRVIGGSRSRGSLAAEAAASGQASSAPQAP